MKIEIADNEVVEINNKQEFEIIYENLILKAIENKQKALNVSSEEYKKWDKIEKETRQEALGFLNRYSYMVRI